MNADLDRIRKLDEYVDEECFDEWLRREEGDARVFVLYLYLHVVRIVAGSTKANLRPAVDPYVHGQHADVQRH